MIDAAVQPSARAWRRLAKRVLLAAGYYDHRLRHVDLPGVAVLCFHGILPASAAAPFGDLHVSARAFAEICAVLVRCCSPVSLSQMIAARGGGPPLPPRPVLVTFDDGYANLLSGALPALERYGVPAAVFVCTDPVERDELFWFDAMALHAGEAAVIAARRLPYAEWRRRVNLVPSFRHRAPHLRPLTLEELRTLAAHPLIDLGAHTLSHPTLAQADRDEQRRQIAGSRERLAALTGVVPRAFAYPYGLCNVDFTAESAALVRDAGFDLAFTTVEAFASTRDDRAALPRFVALSSLEPAELAHRLAHSWHVPR